MIVYIKLILTALFWGGTWVAGRLLAQDLPPYSVAFLRFLIASGILLFIIRKSQGGWPKIRKQHLLPLLLLGLTGVFAYNLFFLQSLRYIEAGRASLIIAFIPVFITLLSALFFRERLNLIKGIGVALSISGAVVVISRGNIANIIEDGIGRGELYIFGCIACWTAYTLIGKRIMKEVPPIVAVGYSAIVGAFFLMIPAVINGLAAEIVRYSVSNWINILYLAVFGTVLAFVWFYEGVQTIGPSKTSVFINFVPVSTLILSALILHEPLTIALLAGAALTLTGVYLTNTAGSRRATRAGGP